MWGQKPSPEIRLEAKRWRKQVKTIAVSNVPEKKVVGDIIITELAIYTTYIPLRAQGNQETPLKQSHV